GRFQTGEFKTRSILSNPSSNDALFNVPPADTLASDDLERGSAYGYYTLELPLRLRITGGASYDHLQMPENFRFPPIKIGEQSRHKLSPKASLVWSPLPELTFRGIYALSLGGSTLHDRFR